MVSSAVTEPPRVWARVSRSSPMPGSLCLLNIAGLLRAPRGGRALQLQGPGYGAGLIPFKDLLHRTLADQVLAAEPRGRNRAVAQVLIDGRLVETEPLGDVRDPNSLPGRRFGALDVFDH